MFLPLFAFALAAAGPVTPPKLDPVVDQPKVCLAAFVEKVQAVSNGGEPVSLIVPLYTDAAKMSAKDAETFANGCALFEQGIVVGIEAGKRAADAPPVAGNDDDEGRAPDRNDELVLYKR